MSRFIQTSLKDDSGSRDLEPDVDVLTDETLGSFPWGKAECTVCKNKRMHSCLVARGADYRGGYGQLPTSNAFPYSPR